MATIRLRAKLTLLIVGIMLVVGLAMGLLAHVHARATLEGELTKRGIAIAGDLAMFSVKPLLENDLATLRRFVNHSMRQEYVRSVAVLDPEGAVVMHSDLAQLGCRPDDPLVRAAVDADTPGYDATVRARPDDPSYGIFFPVTAAGARLGTVVLVYSRAAIEQELSHARGEILWVSLFSAAVAGVLAFLLASYIARPITTIASAMQGASTGEVKPVLVVDRNDEIGLLAASFNQMAGDLSRHRQHLNELVEARTTELRRANARLEIEIAERRRAEDDLRHSREELRNLASHLQSVREQERTDIAREIHDELGQALTALKMDVHWVGRQVGDLRPAVSARTREMSKMLDATVQTVRRISSELRPKLLDDLGLSAAMEWQAREFEQRSGVACSIRSEPDDIVLDRARSTALFRIFQETLTNVARHAGASHVSVVLKNFAGTVELTVSDDGRGVAATQVRDGQSLGIVGMRERVRALGGQLEIVGHRGRGTIVRVSIPCHEEVAVP